MNVPTTFPRPLCQEMQALVSALARVNIDLNDGYADWFYCPTHQQGIRLGQGDMQAMQDRGQFYRLAEGEWTEE